MHPSREALGYRDERSGTKASSHRIVRREPRRPKDRRVFLSNRGMVPAHDLCELLKAGDEEANPGPVCEGCDRKVKTGLTPLECREGGCHVVCHKQFQCKGQRRGSTELWSCNAHSESCRSEGTERAPMPTVRSARAEVCSRCCIKLRAITGVQCAEDSCITMCHKNTACSGISRYSTTAWRCDQHRRNTASESAETLAGRPLASIEQSQPSRGSQEKKSCGGCKRTIAINTVPVRCEECHGPWHTVCMCVCVCVCVCKCVCVCLLGFTRDQVEHFVDHELGEPRREDRRRIP